MICEENDWISITMVKIISVTFSSDKKHDSATFPTIVGDPFSKGSIENQDPSQYDPPTHPPIPPHAPPALHAPNKSFHLLNESFNKLVV